MSIFAVLHDLLKKNLFYFLSAVMIGFLTIASSVGLLSSSALLISKAALHPDVLDLMVLIVIVRFFGLSRGVFRYLERLMSHDITFKVLSSLRQWYYKKFNESYLENRKQYRTGEIYTNLVNDVDLLKDYVLRCLYPTLVALLTGLMTAIFIYFFCIELSLIYIAVYVCCGFVLPSLMFWTNMKLSQDEVLLRKEINIILIDASEGAMEAAVYHMKEELLHKFSKLSYRMAALQKKRSLIHTVNEGFLGFAASVLSVIALVINLPLVASNQLPDIYYAMLPLAMLASFEALIPMNNAVYKFIETQQAGDQMKKVVTAVKTDDAQQEEPTGLDIRVSDISIFGEDNTSILKDISFELPFGKKLAIVGPSGSGKTSLLRALLGFMSYQRGDIRIGDKSYYSLDIEQMRKKFAYLDQSPYLFHTSIKENLMLANTEATPEELKAAVEKAGLLGFIEILPQGLDHIIGQNAAFVSGGEKQRIAIARAILKNSGILLLDEPTASLDSILEKEILAELHKLTIGKSSIWVTHKLICMDKMDEILVLHKGEIVERGTHAQLLNKKGYYHKLWSIQRQCLADD